MRLGVDRDTGKQHPDRVYPPDTVHSVKIFSFRSHRIPQDEKSYKDIRYESGTEKVLLGPRFLGKGLLC